MARVISIHEYDLKPGADVAAFERLSGMRSGVAFSPSRASSSIIS